MDDYTLTDTETEATEPVRAKVPDSTTRFCCAAAAIASLTAFFCLKRMLGDVADIANIFLLVSIILSAALSFRRIPAFIRIGVSACMVAVSLYFLLDFTFTDGTPVRSYRGDFIRKEQTTKHTRRGRTYQHYYALYRTPESRIERVEVTGDDYFQETYPKTINVYEQHGLLGIDVDRGPVSTLARLAWLCFALNFYWLAAIVCFAGRNIDFKGWMTTAALIATGGSMALLYFESSAPVYILTLILSVAALVLALFLSLNYWLADDIRHEPATLYAKKISTSKDSTSYTLCLCLDSGYRLSYDTSKKEYESVQEGDRMTVSVARGRFGMRVIKPA